MCGAPAATGVRFSAAIPNPAIGPVDGGVLTQELMAAPDPKRIRRFALPEMDDARADELINTYVTGPKRRRGRPTSDPTNGGRREDPLVRLDNRITWHEALRRESARSERYRRPASVVVLGAEFRPGIEESEVSVDRLVRPIAHVLSRSSRETDHVMRAGDTRFMVLLPETAEHDAAQFAERIVEDCDVWLAATRTPVYFRVTVAAATTDETLEEAFERATGPAVRG
ncbi:MAG TPA: diguanylate cyclase [Candidatus Limnocylindrales bacterium]|nr:diguanylate cyclase [Candidatus Limnocylindrales bacterium]